MEENDCNEIMCDLGLTSKNSTNKWLLKHHTDKGGNVDPTLFANVTTCFRNREFCNSSRPTSIKKSTTRRKQLAIEYKHGDNNDKNKTNNKMNKATLARRAKIFSCMRQTDNWSKIRPQHKLDNNKFNPNEVDIAIHEASPKLEQLFRIIEQVDENDMATHGKYFKHFIFSDIKEQGYGAKIIASAFIANGYYNLLEARKIANQKALRLTLLATKDDEKDFSFGMLSSTALFKADFNQKFKKQVLTTYNKRPDNIHGENMRFIILDSGFKEGIDLFDVKYVHIFEPSMTTADLKQTIGRATRTCGQKGLNFEPNVGWPLYVYNYYITIPEEIKESYKAADPNLLRNPEEEEYIFKTTKLNEAAMLYSQFDKTLTNLADQLYKLAPIFSVDFALTKNIHGVHDVTYVYDAITSGGSGGGGGGISASKKVKCKGKCGLRSTKDIPATVPFLRNVYLKYNHDKKLLLAIKNKDDQKMRAFFCDYMKQHPLYCKQVNIEWANRAAMVPIHHEQERKIANSSRKLSALKITSKKSSLKNKNKNKNKKQELQLVPYVTPIDAHKYAIEKYTGTKDLALKQKIPGPPPKRLNFIHMRDFIKTNFSKANFIWDKIVVENKCVEANANNANANANANKVGGASHIMNLNPTQDFVRTYFTPQSPYKGMLLWQSVGSGKTCCAVATATSSFERQGYTILWVTRNTLKSDVYKNIFDDVCHIILAERMQRDGLTIPDDASQRKRLLSKNWIEPISYKTFSNLLTPGGHNVYLDKLIAKNGKTDVLRKTLIIIDEAHKLYGGDLKAAERPDMEVMERLLQNSYDKSGKDSARLLIMTATPFTNSPMELFKLINLCKEEPSERITDDIGEFKQTYMDADNMISEAGSKKLADKLSGYINYLNREKDPTQFAQPVMIEVPAMMSHLTDPAVREEIFKRSDASKADVAQQKADVKEQMEDIKELKKRLKETMKNSKTSLKDKKDKCKTIKNKQEKAKCILDATEENERETEATINEIKAELEALQHAAKEGKDTIKMNKVKVRDLKDKVKDLKESLLQEIMLIKRCKNIDLVNTDLVA